MYTFDMIISAFTAYYRAWIGMEKTGGVFKWLDGTSDVTLWGPIEPDYVFYQNCVAMYADGLADIECVNQARYICEIPMPG